MVDAEKRTDVHPADDTVPGLSARGGRFLCPPCGSRWSGQNVAHCATCHQTFGGMSGFDAHRVGKFDSKTDPRRCAKPADVGLTITSRGTWGTAADGVDFGAVFRSPAEARD